MPRLFPDYTPLAVPTATDAVREITFGDSWKFDFNKGEFVLTPRSDRIEETTGVDSLIEWISKTLITPRASYPIYDLWYGCDIERLMLGHGIQIIPDIHRNIRESLMVDDRVKDVTSFTSTVKGDAVFTTFNVIAYNDVIIPVTDERRYA